MGVWVAVVEGGTLEMEELAVLVGAGDEVLGDGFDDALWVDRDRSVL